MNNMTSDMIFSKQNILMCFKYGITINVNAIEIKGDQKNTRAIILNIMTDLLFLFNSDNNRHSPSIVDINCCGPCAKVIKEEKYLIGTGSLNKYLSIIQ